MTIYWTFVTNYNLKFDLLREGEEKTILSETYPEFIRDLSDLKIRSCHAFTGWTLEQIQKDNPHLILMIKELIKNGTIELVGHTYGHPVISIIPDWEVEKQIKTGIEIEEKILGERSKGFYPPEWVIDPTIPEHLEKLGFKWMILLENNVSDIYDNQTKDLFNSKFIEGTNNSKIPTVFKYGGKDLQLRRKIYDVLEGIKTPSHFVEGFLDSAKHEPNNSLLIFYLDSESPFFAKTKENPSPQTKLKEVFELLKKQENFENVTISEYLKRFPPKKVIGTKYYADYKPISVWSEGYEKLDSLLENAREKLLKKKDVLEKAKIDEAWRYIMLAEGSDNRSTIHKPKLNGIKISGRKLFGNPRRLIEGYDYVKKALAIVR